MTDVPDSPQTPYEPVAGTDPTPAAPPRFDRLFEREFDYVHASLRRLGVRQADLPDLTHDVFITVHRHLADFDPSRPVRPWLFGIAFRTALAYKRRARQFREVQDEHAEAVDPTPSADALLERNEAQKLLYDAIAQLDIDRRAVFVLHDLDGVTIPDVAASLEIPLNTAYGRLRLAREAVTAYVRRTQLRRGGR